MSTPEVSAEIDSGDFRQALGHFCTGVTVVTGRDAGGEPVGFACQSFAALSLEPPLVLFCPGRTSRTWPVIERAGRFCVNLLSEAQQDVSSTFGRPGTDKFGSVDWTPAPSGAPVLAGVLGWIDCTVETVHEAGDHYVVIGRVRVLGPHRSERPLLFYRGAYAGLEARAVRAGADLEGFLTWPLDDDWL